jgi:fructosamine-3-kinase
VGDWHSGGVSPSAPSWLSVVSDLLGPIDPPRPLGPGLWRTRVGHAEVVVKLGRGVVDEAEGLRRLAEVDGVPPVPEVVLDRPDLLVTRWVEPGTRSRAHEEALGLGLAALHSAPWPTWGGGSSWIGACPVDPGVTSDGVTFYGSRLLELARRCGMEHSVGVVVDRLGDLLPAGGQPSLVHGDLWWGNVLWGADGRPWLIDPSVHGGWPEEDLAMLSLFGQVPDGTLGAYAERRPLEPGWEDRVGLFQLVPLLVHTVLFGGGYRSQAEGVLARLA